MANIGQTIIIRTDIFELPQDMGLLSAQVAHIHFEFIRDCINNDAHGIFLKSDIMKGWLKDPYIFVKKVPNIESLRYFIDLGIQNDIVVREWNDTIYVRLSPTMKKAFPNTLVGISLGPDDSDKIRSVVGDLPLL